MNQKQIDKLSPLERLDHIKNLIEVADNRAMACDGPVGHVRDCLSDNEWREIYLCSCLPEEARRKGKQISNKKELEKWIHERSRLGYSFKAVKGIVEGCFYDDGSPVDHSVNIAWICVDTYEKFDIIWK